MFHSLNALIGSGGTAVSCKQSSQIMSNGLLVGLWLEGQPASGIH